MNILPLANLKQRKTRAVVSIFGIAIEVMLVLIMVGLVKGTLNEVASRMEHVGADILFQPPGASAILSLSTVQMKASYGEILRSVPGVASVSPVLTWTTQDFGNRIQMLYGIERDAFTNVGGKLEIIKGHHIEAPFDLVVDQRFASSYNVDVGKKLSVLHTDFTVAGICKPGVGARLYASLDTLQNITEQQGKVSFFFIKCKSKDDIRPVMESLKRRFPDYRVQNLEGYAELLASSAAGLKEFITAVITLSIIISFLVILLAMYTAIIERTREIGILKALGATKGYIVKLIMEESLVLCFVGVVVGFALTLLVRYLMKVYMPMTTVQLRAIWMFYAALLGFLGGALGSIYPAFRAARQDPIKALMYE